MRKWGRFEWIAYPLAVTGGIGGAALGFGKGVVLLALVAVIIPLALVIRD